MNPFFSVIIPTYRRPVELKRAVDSVLNQAYEDFELIIVNNAADELRIPVNDGRIRVLMESRKGGNYARNTGIENALGQFVCFLDDDDVYLSNHLQVLHELILKNNSQVALYRTFTKIEDEHGVLTDQPVITKAQEQKPLDHLFTVLMFLGCACCHKDILKEIKFDPSIIVAQDYHFLARVLAKYPLSEAPVVTTIYHKTPHSVSSPSLSTYLNYIKVYDQLFNSETIKHEISPQIRDKRMSRYYDLLLTSHYKELSAGEFLKFSWEASRYNFFYVFSIRYLKLAGKFLFSK